MAKQDLIERQRTRVARALLEIETLKGIGPDRMTHHAEHLRASQDVVDRETAELDRLLGRRNG